MDAQSPLRWAAGARTPAQTYITRVFNFGTWEEWQALKGSFSSAQIREAVRHPLKGQWTRRGKAFAEVLFDCRMSDEVLISFDV